MATKPEYNTIDGNQGYVNPNPTTGGGGNGEPNKPIDGDDGIVGPNPSTGGGKDNNDPDPPIGGDKGKVDLAMIAQTNASIRSYNGALIDRHAELIPLLSSYDGKEVEPFPKNIEELEALADRNHNDENASILLSALDIMHVHHFMRPIDGPPPGCEKTPEDLAFEAKTKQMVLTTKRQLRIAVGLTPAPMGEI